MPSMCGVVMPLVTISFTSGIIPLLRNVCTLQERQPMDSRRHGNCHQNKQANRDNGDANQKLFCCIIWHHGLLPVLVQRGEVRVDAKDADNSADHIQSDAGRNRRQIGM